MKIHLFFAAFVVLGIGAYLFYTKRIKSETREGGKPPISWDLIRFGSALIIVFGLTGIGIKLAPMFYKSLGGTVQLKLSEFDGQSFSGLLSILVGIPVALAGSLYAILLARRAEAIAKEELEGDLAERLDAMAQRVASNFSRFAHALMDLHAASTRLFESGDAVCSHLLADSPVSGAHYERLDSELDRVREKFRLLRDRFTDIQSHGPSWKALSATLKKNAKSLDAALFGDKSKYEINDANWQWPNYYGANDNDSEQSSPGNDQDITAVSEAGAGSNDEFDEARQQGLVNALEILRHQAERLSIQDVLSNCLEGALLNCLNRAQADGEDVSNHGTSKDQLLFYSWLTSGTRKQNQQYVMRQLGRMLKTVPVKKIRTVIRPDGKEMDLMKVTRLINYGAVILEDLYKAVPSRKAVADAILKGDETLTALIKNNCEYVLKRCIGYDTATNALVGEGNFDYQGPRQFPTFFQDGVKDSMRAGSNGDIILELKTYVQWKNGSIDYESVIHKLVGLWLNRHGGFTQRKFILQWKMLYSACIADVLCKEAFKLTGFTKISAKEFETLKLNAKAIENIPTAAVAGGWWSENGLRTQAYFWRDYALAACAAGKFAQAIDWIICAKKTSINCELAFRTALDLDRGDFEMLTTKPGKETIAEVEGYKKAFPKGRPQDLTQFSNWIDGFVRKLSFGLTLQGVFLEPEEVAGNDCMLPLLCAELPKKASGMRYRLNDKAFLNIEAEFYDFYEFPTFVELVVLFDKFFRNLEKVPSGAGSAAVDADDANPRNLADAYDRFYKRATVEMEEREGSDGVKYLVWK